MGSEMCIRDRSNHVNCVPLEEDDARVYVMDSNAKKRSADYYTTLYKTIKDPSFMDNLFSFLSDRVYNPQKMTQLVETKARERLLNRTRSPTGRAFFAAKDALEGLPFTHDMLESYMATHLNIHGNDMMSVNSGELNHLKVANLSQAKIVKLDDATTTTVQAFGLDTEVNTTNINAQLKEAQGKLVI